MLLDIKIENHKGRPALFKYAPAWGCIDDADKDGYITFNKSELSWQFVGYLSHPEDKDGYHNHTSSGIDQKTIKSKNNDRAGHDRMQARYL